MANRRRRRQEDSGVSGVLYVLLVLVLLVGMGCLFYYSRSQSKERQEYIRELESKEAETKTFVTEAEKVEEEAETEMETETEVESETESESESERESEPESETESGSEAETENGVDTERVSEVEAESGAQSEGLSADLSEGENESKSQTEDEAMADAQAAAGEETEDLKNATIMILNGTGKSGVAAYWKRILGAKGYTHIVMADYKGTVEAQTVVYLKNGGDAPVDFYSCYPTLKVKEEAFELSDDVKITAGQDEYDSYDVWIVVGKDDALHD